MLFPVMPSLGKNLLTQVTVHKQSIAVVTPRTSKVDFIDVLVGGDATMIKDVAVGNALWR